MTNDDDLPEAAELLANMRAGNLVTWLKFEALKHGTDNQRERFKEGALPTEELLALARAELYAPLAEWRRWGNRDLHAREVRHERGCSRSHNDVTYKTIGGAELPPMDADTWNYLNRLRHDVNKIAAHEWVTRSQAKVEVAVTRHEARCQRCNAVAYRYSARVIVPWAEHTLVREYLLSDPSATVRA